MNVFKIVYLKFKVPLVLQLSETECGVAALAMLFGFYQVYVPLEVLREKCGAARDGSKAATLLQVAREYGCLAEAFRVEMADILNLSEPVIAFWNFSHYVVICAASKSKIYLHDPALGAVTTTWDEFDKAFTGVVITIKPPKKTTKQSKPSAIVGLIRGGVSPFKQEWCFLLLITSLLICVPLLNSALISVFINYCLIGANTSWIPTLALFSCLFGSLLIWATLIQTASQFKIFTKISLLKSANLIKHILSLPLIFYALQQSSAIIATLARSEAVIITLFKNFTLGILSLLMAVICCVFMVKIDKSLAIKSLVIIATSASILYVLSKINLTCEKAQQNSSAKAYAYTVSTIRNIETIKACCLEKAVLTKWLAVFDKNLQHAEQVFTVSAKINAISQFTDSLAFLTILYWGPLRVSEGYLSVGQLLAYYALHLYFCKNLQATLQALKAGQAAFAAHLRIHDIQQHSHDKRFNMPCTPTGVDYSEPILQCKDVFFFYNLHSAPSLQNINLHITSGQHIALVGDTGSGKSTLAKLLCGLYCPQQGQVLLYDTPLTELTSEVLAENVAYVSQEITLFAGTLYDNLTLWNTKLSCQQINSALALTCLEKLVKQRGLYAKVEENGANFSGGEKQRIDIARALLQNTPLLILDEATSALDKKTQNILIKNLRRLDKTIIFIAHRVDTVQHCDLILFLKNGKIIEQGLHHELLSRKKYYYDLVVGTTC